MRSGSLLLAIMLIAGPARAAGWGGCPPGDYATSQAECITDQMAPDVIDKLYRLALTTVDGKLDPNNVPSDFLYIAEEAGEAARLKSLKPLFEMANSGDVSKIVFAARAITTFLDAVQHGWSHRNRFDEKKDAKLFANAKRILPPLCKQFAARENKLVETEGERCLDRLAPPRSLPQPEEPPAFPVHTIGDGTGGLLGISSFRPSNPKRKAGAKDQKTEKR